MGDLGRDLRNSDDVARLFERVAAARAAARTCAEVYVQVRREAQATRKESRELRTETVRLREQLRETVTAYVSALRGIQTTPERAIVLVKSAVVESDGYPDSHHREVVEEAVRWAVDAYYAA